MIPKFLFVIEIELRRAVESRQFEEAGRLISRYCASAATYVTSPAPESVSAREVAARVSDVLEWANQSLLDARNTIADEIAVLPLLSRYVTPEGHSSPLGIEA